MFRGVLPILYKEKGKGLTLQKVYPQGHKIKIVVVTNAVLKMVLRLLSDQLNKDDCHVIFTVASHVIHYIIGVFPSAVYWHYGAKICYSFGAMLFVIPLFIFSFVERPVKQR